MFNFKTFLTVLYFRISKILWASVVPWQNFLKCLLVSVALTAARVLHLRNRKIFTDNFSDFALPKYKRQCMTNKEIRIFHSSIFILISLLLFRNVTSSGCNLFFGAHILFEKNTISKVQVLRDFQLRHSVLPYHYHRQHHSFNIYDLESIREYLINISTCDEVRNNLRVKKQTKKNTRELLILI